MESRILKVQNLKVKVAKKPAAAPKAKATASDRWQVQVDSDGGRVEANTHLDGQIGHRSDVL